MTQIIISDLETNVELDRQALSEILGGKFKGWIKPRRRKLGGFGAQQYGHQSYNVEYYYKASYNAGYYNSFYNAPVYYAPVRTGYGYC